VRTIVLRAGDFIDTEMSGNWFEGFISAKARKGMVTAPGKPDIPHAWAFLPDMARAAVLLAARRETLAPFEEVLFPGYTLSLREMADLLSRALGRDMRLRPFPWWMIRLAAPFWPMGRHLVEMRYLWNMPHRLDGTHFDDLLPDFTPTDPLTAISQSLGVDHEINPDQPVSGRRLDIAA
jgi:nucleoside-diphosphate-sugar epimerase